jgi:hypothetical protein
MNQAEASNLRDKIDDMVKSNENLVNKCWRPRR